MTTARIGYGKYFKIGKKFYQLIAFKLIKTSLIKSYVLRSGFGYRPDFVRGYERYVVESDMLLSYKTALKFQFLEGLLGLNEKSVIKFRTVLMRFTSKLLLT